MNVSELIDCLEALDPEMLVMSRTYEGGYHDATVQIIDLALNSLDGMYRGPHEGLSLLDDKEDVDLVKAVVLY